MGHVSCELPRGTQVCFLSPRVECNLKKIYSEGTCGLFIAAFEFEWLDLHRVTRFLRIYALKPLADSQTNTFNCHNVGRS